MSSVSFVGVTPLYNDGVTLQWAVDAPKTGVYSFTVQRSGGPEGPWEDLAVLLDGFIYKDVSADTCGLTRDIYYRLSVLEPDGVTIYTPARNLQDDLPLGLAGRHFLRARKMRSDLLRTFQKFSGREFYVLKRKHWGARCADCYDELTKTLVSDDCGTCYGTSFSGGYHTPILVWGRFDPAPISAPLQMEGLLDQRMRRFVMLDVPWVMPDDVLVSKTVDRRYLVHTHSQTEMREATVHQDVSVAELKRDSQIYHVPVGA